MSQNSGPSLLVDFYELSMAEVYLAEGMAGRPATFSLFVRKLPPGRGFLVAAGLDDCLSWLEGMRFGEAELEVLRRVGRFDDSFLDWLGELRFTGTVRAVPEGTIVFAGEPILEVDGPLGEAQLAETFLLNQVTLQTVLATKAARCLHAAQGRTLVDFALRRTHGIDAGMKLARVSRLVGLDGTSNVAGADAYGLPALGTMAHSFVQASDDEGEAFRTFARRTGDRAVLLVDTYDTLAGIDLAVQVALERREEGSGVRAIRIDSGNLGGLAFEARRRLDAAGLDEVRIFVSGGLDEYEIDRLLRVERAPIDGFGVGSSLGVPNDAPSLDTVYKLVSYDGRPVRKTSPGKETWPGRKQVWRASGWSYDILALAEEAFDEEGRRPLMVPVMEEGRRTAAGSVDLAGAAGHFRREWGSLPPRLKELSDPRPYRVVPSEKLQQITAGMAGAAVAGGSGRREEGG